MAWLPGQVWGAHLNIVRGGEAGGDSGVLPGKMWGHTIEVWAAVDATDVYTVMVFLKHERSRKLMGIYSIILFMWIQSVVKWWLHEPMYVLKQS